MVNGVYIEYREALITGKEIKLDGSNANSEEGPEGEGEENQNN